MVLNEYEPDDLFCVSVGGYLDNAYAAYWEDGALYYVYSPPKARTPEVKVELRPSREEWERFWKRMDELGVWNWEQEYKPIGSVFVADGPYWQVILQNRGRKLESNGYACYPPLEEKERFFYPDEQDDPEFIKSMYWMRPGPTFKALLEAASELTGGRTFEV